MLLILLKESIFPFVIILTRVHQWRCYPASQCRMLHRPSKVSLFIYRYDVFYAIFGMHFLPIESPSGNSGVM